MLIVPTVLETGHMETQLTVACWFLVQGNVSQTPVQSILMQRLKSIVQEISMKFPQVIALELVRTLLLQMERLLVDRAPAEKMVLTQQV